MNRNRNLHALFRPASIAFIGGSNLRAALRYHREQGFAGKTFVISPKYEQIEGFACTATLAELPSAPDLAFVGVARRAAVEVVTELRDLGCKSVICNAAGFLETGDDELQGGFECGGGQHGPAGTELDRSG